MLEVQGHRPHEAPAADDGRAEFPTKTKVSAVVACRNEARHIEPFLDSLWRQDVTGIDLEVVVADGRSTDGSKEILEKHRKRHARVRLLDNPGMIVSTGLNAAIRAASGDIIVRMDAHTEYAPDYIRQCLKALEETGADNVGGSARTRTQGLLACAIAAAYHTRFACGGAKFHDETYKGYADTVPYGCWRKSTLERLGLFDETLVRNQDDELNLRLIRAGGKVWQSPRIVSWYHPRTSLSALFRQYFQYGFWKVPVILKHRMPASWRHLAPGAFVLANVLLLLASAGAILIGSSTWLSSFLTAWAALAGVYASACVAAATLAVGRHGWLVSVTLPFLFPVYHLSYGLGFLLGLLYWPWKRWSPIQPGKLFTGITR